MRRLILPAALVLAAPLGVEAGLRADLVGQVNVVVRPRRPAEAQEREVLEGADQFAARRAAKDSFQG